MCSHLVSLETYTSRKEIQNYVFSDDRHASIRPRVSTDNTKKGRGVPALNNKEGGN